MNRAARARLPVLFTFWFLGFVASVAAGEETPSVRAGLLIGMPQQIAFTFETPHTGPWRFQGSIGVGAAFAATGRIALVRPTGAIRPYAFAGAGLLGIVYSAGPVAGAGVAGVLWTGGGIRVPFGTAELFAELGVLGDAGLDEDTGAAAIGIMFPFLERTEPHVSE